MRVFAVLLACDGVDLFPYEKTFSHYQGGGGWVSPAVPVALFRVSLLRPLLSHLGVILTPDRQPERSPIHEDTNHHPRSRLFDAGILEADHVGRIALPR